jgi:uncharacterized membrane protein YbhN (UPF0104 family)
VIVLLALGASLALAASIGMAYVAGFHQVAARLRDPDLLWLPMALAGAVAAHLGYVLAYREVSRVESGPPLGLPRIGALVATGFGAFVPRGGFALDLEALRDLGVAPREARVRVLGLGSLEYVVLATGALVCSVVLLVRHPEAHRAVTLSWTIGVPLGTLLALVALRYRERLCRGRLGAPLRPALDGVAVVGKILARPREHAALALVGMSVYWSGEVFVLWACLAAFTDGVPSVPAVVLGYATGYALTRRTLPLAGTGAVEVLLPLALMWVGQPLASALLAVVAYRVFNVWLPVGPAVAGLISLQRRHAGELAATADAVRPAPRRSAHG